MLEPLPRLVVFNASFLISRVVHNNWLYLNRVNIFYSIFILMRFKSLFKNFPNCGWFWIKSDLRFWAKKTCIVVSRSVGTGVPGTRPRYQSSWSEKPEFLRAANQGKIGKKDLIWGAPYKNISNFTNINTDRRKKVNSTFERSMQQVSIVLFIFFWNFLNQKLHLILQWKIVKNRDFFDDFQEKNHDFCDKKVM